MMLYKQMKTSFTFTSPVQTLCLRHMEWWKFSTWILLVIQLDIFTIPPDESISTPEERDISAMDLDCSQFIYVMVELF